MKRRSFFALVAAAFGVKAAPPVLIARPGLKPLYDLAAIERQFRAGMLSHYGYEWHQDQMVITEFVPGLKVGDTITFRRTVYIVRPDGTREAITINAPALTPRERAADASPPTSATD